MLAEAEGKTEEPRRTVTVLYFNYVTESQPQIGLKHRTAHPAHPDVRSALARALTSPPCSREQPRAAGEVQAAGSSGSMAWGSSEAPGAPS